MSAEAIRCLTDRSAALAQTRPANRLRTIVQLNVLDLLTVVAQRHAERPDLAKVVAIVGQLIERGIRHRLVDPTYCNLLLSAHRIDIQSGGIEVKLKLLHRFHRAGRTSIRAIHQLRRLFVVGGMNHEVHDSPSFLPLMNRPRDD